MTTLIKRPCDICNKEFSANSEGELNRKIAVHKRFSHNVPGKLHRGLQIATRDSVIERVDPKVLERRKYQKRWWRKKKKKDRALERQRVEPVKQNRGHEVEPCALTSCPVCKSRFYVCKGEV